MVDYADEDLKDVLRKAFYKHSEGKLVRRCYNCIILLALCSRLFVTFESL